MALEELIESHCGAQAYETAWAFNYLPHEKEIKYDTNNGDVISIVAYFPLERLNFDMIIMIHKDNKFSLSQWKWLKNKLINRQKEIRIAIVDNKDYLAKLASKYGGILQDDVLIFKE